MKAKETARNKATNKGTKGEECNIIEVQGSLAVEVRKLLLRSSTEVVVVLIVNSDLPDTHYSV